MSEELSIENPRGIFSDKIPARVKIIWKKIGSPFFGNPYYQTIIPKTKNHGEWILGAQLDLATINYLLKEAGTNKVHIVSMLSDDETIISDSSLETIKNVKRTRIHWFDHTVLNLIIGRNQPVQDMVALQRDLYKEFGSTDTTFYCHCMAGRSRSFVETMAFIYFYPEEDRAKLFDFEEYGWDEIKEKIDCDLQKRLQSRPLFSDIAEFVRVLRPKAKAFKKLDGDQAGLLGLMALDKISRGLEQSKEMSREKLLTNASDIGLMLKAPLDISFRDPKDRKIQEENLILVYQAYQSRGMNLLTEIIIYHHHGLKKDESGPVLNFENNFLYLKTSEQARFAILLKRLEQHNSTLVLEPLRKSIEYAKIALKKPKQLTAGDQVELLRSFGPELDLNSKDVSSKILKGDPLDRHNADIQLIELLKIK